MRCNYKPPKLSKEEQQTMANIKTTLPYIDRLQVQWRNSESEEDYCEEDMLYNRAAEEAEVIGDK